LTNATPLIPSLPSFMNDHRAFVNLEEAVGSLRSLMRSVDVLYTVSTNTVLGEGIGLVTLVRPKVLSGIHCF